VNAAAAGILLTHGERALFLKRSPTARDHAGEWCCPGGSVEGGETLEQAARRETAEETGIAGLITGDLTRIDEGNGFVTFRQNVGEEADPVLDGEHTEFKWAPMSDPPTPLHPGVAATLKKLLGGSAHDRREYDSNNWFEVLDNPLSTVGVYQYNEASVKKGGDPRKMVGVYRPAEELSDPETVKSFQLTPWTDDHPDALLGDASQGLVPAEEKGIHGVIGEKVYYRDGTLYGNIKVFSEALARKQAAGKRELSLGYRCDFVPSEGVYEGVPYQYVQKNLRGNHLSSVSAGRMGSGVRVLDAAEPPFGYFTFALDLKEPIVPEKRKDEQDCSLDADTRKFIEDSFGSLVGQLETKGYSKEYATKVAGKVAAEKGMTGHHQSTDGATTVAKVAKDEEGGSTAGEIKNPVKKDDSPDDLEPKSSSTSSKDAESAESEEMAKDAREETCDASEEEKDKDKDDKPARDRKSARDGRAAVRDYRKSARDSAKSARDAKMAKDAEEKTAKEKEAEEEAKAKAAKDAAKGGKGMDAAEVTSLVQRSVAAAVAAVGPTLRREEAAKNALYGRLSPIIGAFDHSEMTLPAMAGYGLKKLGVAAEAADPVTALDFLLVGRSQAQVAPASGQRTFAQDAGSDSFVDKYIAA
jgi:8-oxo-dGTP pyrophosphatase MutT (NUDIX family)